MTARHPRIGITCNWNQESAPSSIPQIVLGSLYARAIMEAGGVPILCAPAPEKWLVEEYTSMIDGLLLTGGRDIDPSRYGQEPHKETRLLAEPRESFDIELFLAAFRAKIPIFAICAGSQQVNVALGGTLHQHIPDITRAVSIEHRNLDKSQPPPRHEVEILPETRLLALVGKTRLLANSSHHQAVDRLADGMRLAARAPDGVAEAFESAEGDQVLAVQWHPEYLTSEREHRVLFEDLIKRAQRYMAQRAETGARIAVEQPL